MKNLHLLPTDRPSRLHFDDKLFLSPNYQNSKTINSIVEGRNIYITNDEGIKDGWSYDRMMKSIGKRDNVYSSKIILTTDSKLITDGVQSIDNTFLEWYVKNLCEEVEVESNWEFLGDDYRHGGEQTLVYKLIIPVEEPKPVTLSGFSASPVA